MTRIFKSVTLALVAIVATAVPAMAQDFPVIVNSANSTADLSAVVAAKLFLKQSPKFPNGTAAQPADRAKVSDDDVIAYVKGNPGAIG
ncbi:hypothetical protein [Gemmatimonas sp.]|jgi:hypothetical protein|uniref:hypothetical protein n=1 Tax=Gemmatimonas sp. TaxID=1962908 RepID=UPI0031C3B647|nr:hypothetical protein [Gemmatimonas sp.]